MKRRAKLRLPGTLRKRSRRGERSGLASWWSACWCWRCALDRLGIYRRRRTLDTRGIQIEWRCCGILLRRDEVPLNGNGGPTRHGKGHPGWTTTPRAT